MNKRKRSIAIIVLGIMLVGIVSADLLPFFGKISGSATVEAPVFYLDSSVIPISPHSSDLAYRFLSINEIPNEENVTYLFNGNRLIYITEPLGINSFYDTEFNIKIRVKTNERGNLLQVRILKIDDNMIESEICEPAEPINISSWYDQFRIREISCPSSGEIVLDSTDRIGLEIRGIGGTSEYQIKTAGDYNSTGSSRIEVIPK